MENFLKKLNDPPIIKIKRCIEKLKFYDGFIEDRNYTHPTVVFQREEENKSAGEICYCIYRHNNPNNNYRRYCLTWNFKHGCSRPAESLRCLDLDELFDKIKDLVDKYKLYNIHFESPERLYTYLELILWGKVSMRNIFSYQSEGDNPRYLIGEGG